MATHKNSNFLWQSHHPRGHPEPSTEHVSQYKENSCQDCKSLGNTLDNALSPSSGALLYHSLRVPWFLLSLLMLSHLPHEVWSTTFRIALVGPWTCDPMYSKSLPEVAAHLAMSRINKDPHLNRGYWYDHVLVHEDCQTSQALARFASLQGYASAFLGPANPGYCTAAALLAEHWNTPLLPWVCPGVGAGPEIRSPKVLRPLPLASNVLFAVLRFFHWARVAVAVEESDLWEATAHELAASLRTLGLPVHTVVTISAGAEGSQWALEKIRGADRVKVVIMCMQSALMGGEVQRRLLTTAAHMRMVEHGYVFIPFDTLLYPLPYRNVSYPVLAEDAQLQRAYDGVLTITMDQGEQNFYEAFREAQERNQIQSTVTPEQVSPFFASIYNMLYYTAMVVEQTRVAGGARWVTGDSLARSDGGFEFAGFNQPLWAGGEGRGMQVRYAVLDTDGVGTVLHRTHVLEAGHTDGGSGALRYTGRSIHFAGSSPSSDASCWFSSCMACSGGVDGVTFCFLFLLFCAFVAASFSLYNMKKSGQVGILGVFGGGRGGPPSKIVLTLDDLVFINTQLSKKKLNEDSTVKGEVDVKTPCHSVSGRSYITSTPENSSVAVFEGDWVWLKKCPSEGSFSDVSKITQAVFIQLRDMRQENLNLFLGLFLGSGIFGIVTEHCTRGSLEDLLSNKEMKLDWMFKSSLLMDLVRGMKHLHSHGVVHGRLKSRNCVVDSRFVLKVTDYGLNEIMNSLNIAVENRRPEDQLWTAPEMLRSGKQMLKGTSAADVFSFSIIIQEVISRSTPYCMLDIPPQEIIDKVRSPPPPLCRPFVSVDEAPLEVIQIMKQAWSEDPHLRPTFEEIFKQFKSLRKGKKTNLIDSMLRMLEQYSTNLEDLIRERTEELEVERQKTDALVAQMLPKSVALALKKGKPVTPEHFLEATLYFSDIVGFTTISALSEPIEVVDLLNDLYTLFDSIIGMHDVYKVETIGDAYMVASGVPIRNGNRHAAEMANMSLDILSCISTFKMRHMPGVKVKIRIGLHSGPVVAGVVGLTMPRYCLFGDTVNTASRMESTGLPYRIHVNQSTVRVLRELRLGYQIERRGKTELKGKGFEETFWLVGREGFTKPLPIPPDLTPGASNHGISLEEIPLDRRQRFLDRQKRMG
ncbi:retinal guanylyl cyclase 1 [Electrophorus electricus]|uniref:retinal guanylyl cyclase 1 n=1 Tax=Electrophorus electricus TaxID=8005 RepID=UPI0015D006F6|nr:retinal guanylyl cyclase 1 [Electrophorus electricus]